LFFCLIPAVRPHRLSTLVSRNLTAIPAGSLVRQSGLQKLHSSLYPSGSELWFQWIADKCIPHDRKNRDIAFGGIAREMGAKLETINKIPLKML
jgi:hypothetical protein